MKLPRSPELFSALVLSVLLSGCTTMEVSQPAPVAKPVATAPAATQPAAPAAATAGEPAQPVAQAPAVAANESKPALETPALPPVVEALVVHLTDSTRSGTLPHDLVDTTGFPEALASLAPGATAPKTEPSVPRLLAPARGLTAEGDSVALVERDWTGLVLVPINKSLSKAYTSSVRLLKVEAHPLSDGRIRVWIRLQNVGPAELPSEVACAFSMNGDERPVSPNFYELQVPSREYRDVFFVSPGGDLTTYTVLIRSNPFYRVSSR